MRLGNSVLRTHWARLLQISESMDALTKRALRHINLKMVKGQLDVPRISLQLLSSVGKLDFQTERLRVQWQKRQVRTFDCFYLWYVNLSYYCLYFCYPGKCSRRITSVLSVS